MNFKIDKTNMYNPINNNMQDIINSFVSVYGEQYRTLIEKKINNVKIIFTTKGDLNEITENINDYYDEEIKKLTINAFKDVAKGRLREDSFIKSIKSFNNIEDLVNQEKLSKDDIDKAFEIIISFGLDLSSVSPIKNYNKALKEWFINEKNKNAFLESVKIFKDNYNKNYSQKVESLEEEKKSVLKIYKDILKPYQNIQNKNNKALNDILVNHLIKNNGNKDNKNLEYYVEVLKELIDNGYDDFAKINSNDLSIPAMVKIRTYIKLFNFLGFNKGDNIKNYQNDSNLLNVIFDKQFISNYNNQVEKTNIDNIKFNPSFNNCLKEIQTLNLKGGNYSLTEVLYNYLYKNQNQDAFTAINVTKENKIKPVIVCKDLMCAYQHDFIHELNHAVSSSIIEENQNEYTAKVGIEKVSFEYQNKDFSTVEDFINNKQTEKITNKNSKNLRMLNEVFNDYISLKISDDLSKKGVKFFKQEYMPNSYSVVFPVLKNFLNDNLEIIKKSYLAKNQNAFERCVGTKNLNILAEIANQISQIKDETLLNIIDEANARNKNKQYTDIYSFLEDFRDIYSTSANWSANAKHLYKLCDTADKISEVVKQHNLQTELNK